MRSPVRSVAPPALGFAALLAVHFGVPVPSHAQSAPAERLQAALESITPERLRAHLVELAGDAYEGRGAGYPGGARATVYIARHFEAVGLIPVGDTIDGHPTFLQRFQLHPRRPPEPWAVFTARNVVGLFEGDDPVLAREVVVVGAHHDGQGMEGQADMGRRRPPDSAESTGSSARSTTWRIPSSNGTGTRRWSTWR